MDKVLSRKEFIKAALLSCGIGSVALIAGCGTQTDPQIDDQYTRSVYPVPTDTQHNGSELYRWLDIHTKELYVNGVQIGGGIPFVSVAIYTDTHTLDATNYIVICNKATAMTINLPSATGSNRLYEIKNVGAGVVTVDGDLTDTIDDELTQEVQPNDAISIVDYAANRWAIY